MTSTSSNDTANQLIVRHETNVDGDPNRGRFRIKLPQNLKDIPTKINLNVNLNVNHTYSHNRAVAPYPPVSQIVNQRTSSNDFKDGVLSGMNGPMMEYIERIGDDWNCSNGRRSDRNKNDKNKNQSSSNSSTVLILADSNDSVIEQVFTVGSSTTLKSLFNDYSEKRGVSLRSLRFSHRGKTLFLSSVGNKTPDELNMRNADVILVHDVISQETTTSTSTSSNLSSQGGNKKTTKKSNKGRGNNKRNKKKKRHPEREYESTKTLQEYKVEHSFVLSKLHEEAQVILKEIRTRLTALDLDRQPKKKRSKRGMKGQLLFNNNNNCIDYQILPNSGIGGKAGKSCYGIQVGEVQNLYKTTNKPSSSSSSSLPTSTSTLLDLHGCTKEEALSKLNESLPTWVDTAMRGSYPFVIQANIVCGCGSQVLSEVVEKWIREHEQVANRPKGR